MLTNIKERILEKLKILSLQITAETMKELEQELVKFNATGESVFDFKTGYSYHDNLFSVSFNIRATKVLKNSIEKTNWNYFFENVLTNLSTNSEKAEGIEESLDKLLEIKNTAFLKIYPAMFLEQDNSIAIMFHIKKTVNET